ncbi:hypothetical protein IMZ48_34940 [Candidatus Bathyarchaeota archaeon]|nr:hypothetical protein [Candidatus Bathyarchaeota archaeon]
MFDTQNTSILRPDVLDAYAACNPSLTYSFRALMKVSSYLIGTHCQLFPFPPGTCVETKKGLMNNLCLSSFFKALFPAALAAFMSLSNSSTREGAIRLSVSQNFSLAASRLIS